MIDAEAMAMARNLRRSWLRGVAPSQYPIFRSVTKAPDMERAVQTAAPMEMAMI